MPAKLHSLERSKTIAAGYDALSHFKRDHPGVYKWCNKHGKVKEVTGHMKKRVPLNPMTDEEIINEGLKYDRAKDFRDGSRKHYEAARKRGLLSKIKEAMPDTMIYHTHQSLQEEALKYNSRSDFESGSNKHYNAALRRGIMDDICQHMGAKYQIYSFDRIHRIALKHDNLEDFLKFDRPHHNAAILKGIVNEVCDHMEPPKGCDYQAAAENNLLECAAKYDNFGKMQLADPGLYRAIEKAGMIDKARKILNCRIMHSREKIAEEASKYMSRQEFFEGSSQHYHIAAYRGIMDEVCAHMPPSINHGFSRSGWVSICKEKCWLYAVQIDAAHCKVGITSRPIEHRLKELPSGTSVLKVLSFTDFAKCYDTEKILIRKLMQSHEPWRGESFGGCTETFKIQPQELLTLLASHGV